MIFGERVHLIDLYESLNGNYTKLSIKLIHVMVVYVVL